MEVRAHVIISGKVQGVFFRAHTKSIADRLGVKGWVRNLPDGRVEAVFEGERDSVEEVIEWCWRGPPAARVTNVEVSWEKFKGDFSSFKIIY